MPPEQPPNDVTTTKQNSSSKQRDLVKNCVMVIVLTIKLFTWNDLTVILSHQLKKRSDYESTLLIIASLYFDQR